MIAIKVPIRVFAATTIISYNSAFSRESQPGQVRFSPIIHPYAVKKISDLNRNQSTMIEILRSVSNRDVKEAKNVDLQSPGSNCTSTLSLTRANENICKSDYCTSVLQCKQGTFYYSVSISAKEGIEVAKWNFEQKVNDLCIEQYMKFFTPNGDIVVAVGKYGFEFISSSSPERSCKVKTF